MGFEIPIDNVCQQIDAFLKEAKVESSGNLVETPLSFEILDKILPDLVLTLQSIESNYAVGELPGVGEETKQGIDKFNSSIQSQSRDFVLLMAITKSVDRLIDELRATEETNVSFKEFQLSPAQLAAVEQLCGLLDWMVWLSAGEKYPSIKNDFYQILQLISESLANISSDLIGVFWYYLETRENSIRSYIFDPKLTLNRIAILGLCNGLTDKYYSRRKGKLDSYQKDTFNDRFQARVRTFLTKLFLFDDLTGLNKYFSIANRVNREPNLGKAKNGDDELLQDILLFYRLLRDPYTYLKNVRMLTKQAESLDRLYAYLLDEELKYAKRHPIANIQNVRTPKLEKQAALLQEKYSKDVFFPEHYWLAPFEQIQRGPTFDVIKAEDQKVALKQLDSAKHRQLLLIQIYLVCSFYIDLLATRKSALLKEAGAPSNTKHIIDENTPELLMRVFTKIKSEIPRKCRAWDAQLSNLLLQSSQAEEFWLSWLLYGKDKDGLPLLGDKTIKSEDIQQTLEKFENAVPYKTKRYFNTHVTPALSRKMKTRTGLGLLEDLIQHDDTYQDQINSLDAKISELEDSAEKAQLIEDRSVLRWKNLKLMRGTQWLEFNNLLEPEMLGLPEVKVEVKEPEKPTEAVLVAVETLSKDDMEIDETNVPIEEASKLEAEAVKSSAQEGEVEKEASVKEAKVGETTVEESKVEEATATDQAHEAKFPDPSAPENGNKDFLESRKRARSDDDEEPAPAEDHTPKKAKLAE